MADLCFENILADAIEGNGESVDQLVRTVQPRIRAYILRATLDQNLTDDICQETVFNMVKSLSNLRSKDKFWQWLFRIASNCIKQHHRKNSREATHFSVLGVDSPDNVFGSPEEDDHLENHELQQHVMDGIAKLKELQRQIVSLRCFEQLSYNEIAQTLGCSTTSARVNFFRAKKTLKNHLSKQGYSTVSLGFALTLFGKLTAETEAASLSVSGSALKGTGTGIAILSVLTATAMKVIALLIAVLAGSAATYVVSDGGFIRRDDVYSVHYAEQGIYADQATQELFKELQRSGRSLKNYPPDIPYKSKGAYENLLYLPQGPDGAVLRFQQRWTIDRKSRLCSWLQDSNANYYYNSGGNTIYITNDPLGLLILPCDEAHLRGFILGQLNQDERLVWKEHRLSKMLDERVDNRVSDVRDFTTDYVYNTLKMKDLTKDWPQGAKVIDSRDQMHKRGWTYFHVSGQLNSLEISGQGLVPFVYNKFEKNNPWIDIKVGNRYRLVDDFTHAYIIDNGEIVNQLEGGSFFNAIGRPWLGIRAYDSVRRDAARANISFKGTRIGELGMVGLRKNQRAGIENCTYNIDMAGDLIKTVVLNYTDGSKAQLGFDFMQDIHDVEYEKTDISNLQSVSRGAVFEKCWLYELWKLGGSN